jgi:glycosyltransferase involved in cell wall biosynthesis
MKIAHIITRLILGGAQENTLLTCEGLHARGHEVTLVTGPTYGPEGQLLDRARAGGYKVIELASLHRAIQPLRDWRCYRELKKLLAELAPDIVHTHSAKAGVLGRYAGMALRRDKTRACCSHLEKFQAAQDQGGRPRIVHTIHGLAFHAYQAPLANKLYVAVERAAARKCDLLITVAQAMTDQALAAGVGTVAQYVKIFSGMETEKYLPSANNEHRARLREKYHIDPEAVVIATVARLFELKGHEYIIEAARTLAAKHENVVWLFIGDGSWRDRIENQIRDAGLQSRFRLTGLVEPDAIGPLLQASDILVHCSLREGLARALPQALLCERPAISFDVDGAREVVFDGKTGFLVPPRNVAKLIEVQEKLITDSVLREQMGRAGRELCEKEFDHNAMVEKIERMYEQIL